MTVSLKQVEESKCGYQNCPKPKPGKINVHLIAHSHDDVGWLKRLTNIIMEQIKFIKELVSNTSLIRLFKRLISIPKDDLFTLKWHSFSNGESYKVIQLKN